MGILQARLPEWVAISPSRGPSQPRARARICISCVSCIGGFFTTEPRGSPLHISITFKSSPCPHFTPGQLNQDHWDLRPRNWYFFMHDSNEQPGLNCKPKQEQVLTTKGTETQELALLLRAPLLNTVHVTSLLSEHVS